MHLKMAFAPLGVSSKDRMLETHDDQEAMLVYDELDVRHGTVLALHGLCDLLNNMHAPLL